MGKQRSYKWLVSRLQAAETTGGKAIFEMVYLNKAFAEGIAMFDVEEVDLCRDVNRVVGQVPAGCRLVAGLDPHQQVIKLLSCGLSIQNQAKCIW